MYGRSGCVQPATAGARLAPREASPPDLIVIETIPPSSTRVLLVEHEARLRDSMAAGLGLDRYACEAVADGMAALQQAAAKAFDLVLIDLGAPHVARLQICRTLRHYTLNRHVAIVIIAPGTALAAALTEIEHGADDF